MGYHKWEKLSEGVSKCNKCGCRRQLYERPNKHGGCGNVTLYKYILEDGRETEYKPTCSKVQLVLQTLVPTPITKFKKPKEIDLGDIRTIIFGALNRWGYKIDDVICTVDDTSKVVSATINLKR